MKWELSDGTAVELGGGVTGESQLAALLRDDVHCLRMGWPGPRFKEYEPSAGVPLDLDEPQHVDQWVRNIARCLDVEILTAPALPWIAGTPDDDAPGPEVIN